MNVVAPKSWQDIANDCKPRSPEGSPWWLYDTQTYTDNSTTSLTFFAATVTDQSLSNLPSGGILPADQALFVHNIYIDYINNVSGNHYVSTGAAVQVGALNDIGRLHINGRGRLLLKIRSKDYGPFPMTAFQGLGGVDGGESGTYTATNIDQWANNALGVGSGRGAFGGSIVIPPQTSFKVTLDWPAAVDLQNDYRIRVTLHGALYRNVQ